MATIKSIKEKAKAYDKAIEKAKNCLKDGTITNTAISYIGTIFPELIESEDERVRKELLSFFTERAKYTEDSTFNGLSSKEIISWLEKQGEHAKFRDSIQVGDKLTLNEDGVLVNLTQLNRVANKGIENAIKAKQGEQKPKVNLHVKCIANKVEPFKYEGLTDFERTLADICIGWIGEEPGWKQYIKDNADVLLKIAAKNSTQYKMLPLTWDDMREIYCITLNLREHLGASVFGEPLYQEVLKHFKYFRERKEK